MSRMEYADDVDDRRELRDQWRAERERARVRAKNARSGERRKLLRAMETAEQRAARLEKDRLYREEYAAQRLAEEAVLSSDDARITAREYRVRQIFDGARFTDAITNDRGGVMPIRPVAWRTA